MGCVSSKVDNEETVARCKARKRFMKQAVSSRHAFAVAHCQYLQALKDTGFAIRQFAVGAGAGGDVDGQEGGGGSGGGQVPAPPVLEPAAAAASSPRGHGGLPSPPSSPPMSPPRTKKAGGGSKAAAKAAAAAAAAAAAKPAELAAQESWQQSSPHRGRPPPPPTPTRSSWQAFLDPFRPPAPPLHLQEQRKLKQLRETDSSDSRDKSSEDDAAPAAPTQAAHSPDEAASAAAVPSPAKAAASDSKEASQQDRVAEQPTAAAADGAVLLAARQGHLMEVLKAVDEQFARSSECGDQMCRMLETRKMHYISNFAENKGYFENSSRVFNSYSSFFNRSASSKTLLPAKTGGDDGVSQDECGAMGSHAATLDRLFAWEKKLFDEVKGAEIIRVELAKKVVQLRHQEARGEDPLAIEKTRALIKSLQTRVMVAFQAVDGALAKIQELRDEELYPQLLELLDGMRTMWKEMLECHNKQKTLVLEIQSLGVDSGEMVLTSAAQRQLTVELEAAVTKWQAAFNAAMTAHKEYMTNLNGWLRLSMMQAVSEEPEFKDKSGSPAKPAVAPIFILGQEWQQALDRLPYSVATEGITTFIGVVRTIISIQLEEVRQQKRKEATEKELEKKIVALSNYEKKYVEPWIPPPTSDSEDKSEVTEEAAPAPENPYFTERKAQVDSLRKRLEEEDISVGKAIQDTRSVTLSSMQQGLPQIFASLSTFCSACAQTFDALHSQGLTKASKFSLLTDK